MISVDDRTGETASVVLDPEPRTLVLPLVEVRRPARSDDSARRRRSTGADDTGGDGTGVEEQGTGDPAGPEAPARHRVRTVLVLATWTVVLVAFVAAMWSRRWVADDGFINFRIVDNIVRGHGPVFNVGERVEVGTSQLWLVVLAAARLAVGRWVQLEWLAVVLGLACSAGAVVVAGAGHRRAWGAPVVPFGLLAWVAVPAVWDFSSSGLEGPLLWLWMAGCFAALVTRAVATPRRTLAAPWWLPALIGLGPLIRPDAAVYSVGFGIALFVVSRKGWTGALKALGLALAVPVVAEVARAGYFGTLVPNTALAKDAGGAEWAAGWRYLADFVRVEALWLPLGVLVVTALYLGLARLVRARVAAVWALTVLAGLLHAAWVVRIGGDFMHARLLLPDWFALVLPLAALPLATLRRFVPVVATLALLGWSVWAWGSVRAEFKNHDARGVIDERTNYVRASGRPHPVTLEDYGSNLWMQWGRLAGRTAARGRSSVLWPQPVGPVFVTPSRSGTYVVWPNIGLLGYAAGPDVHVVDGYGLADPIASRLEVQGWGRAGHSRSLPSPWIEARFSPRSSWVGTWTGEAARVLRCPAVKELEEAVAAPLTPGRFVSNVLASPRLTRLSIPAAPAAAARKLC